MILKRKIRIQIYNTAGTQVEYDSDTDTSWGITAGSISLNKLIMEEELMYGDLNSSMLQVQVFNISADISKRKIVVTVTDTVDTQSYIVDDEGNYLVDDLANKLVGADGTAQINDTIFTGWIDSAKQDHSGVYRDIVAYDWIYYHRTDNVASWWNNLWGQGFESIALSGIRDSLLSYMDIDTDIPSGLINDNLLITNNLINATSMSVLTFETVMQMISILQNVSPHIKGDGELTLIHLDSTGIDVTDNLETENSMYEDYVTNPITGIAVYDTSDNLVQVIGTDANVYKIVGNLFLLNMTAQQLTNACTPLLNDLATLQYIPASLSLIMSNLSYDVGNKITTTKGTTFVFRTQLYGSLLVNQVLESYAFGPDLNTDVYSANEDLMIGNKISRIDKNIDGIITEVADLALDVSTQIIQQADSIIVKVNNAGTVSQVTIGKMSSDSTPVFQVSAENIDFIANNNMQLTAKNLGITSTNFSVTPAGVLTSKSGVIGGWTIDTNSIYKTVTINSAEYTPMLYAPTNPTATQYPFCVRRVESGQTTYPFAVRYDGQMLSTAGTIGGWRITANSLYSEYTDSYPRYRVTIRTNEGSGSDSAIYTRTIPSASTPSSDYEYPFVLKYDGSVIMTKANITGVVKAETFRFTDSIQAYNSWNRGTYTLFTHICNTEQIWSRIYTPMGENAITLIGYDAGDWTDYRLYLAGNTYVNGYVNATRYDTHSSKHLKKNIKNITEKEAKKLLELRPVSFDYKEGSSNNRGLIAEEVLDIYPEIVNVPEGYTEFNPKHPNKSPSIDYTKFIPYLIKMIQVQQKEIDALKKSIK